MLDLSISIVNHNNKELLDKCLNSIYTTTKKITFEVFVVDNASTDGSPSMVQQKYPQVKLVQNTVRKGFATNHNQSLRLSKGRYLLILNEDTELLSGSLDAMVEFMQSHSDAGAIGPKKLNPDGSVQPDSGRVYSLPLLLGDLLGIYKLLGRNRFSVSDNLSERISQVKTISGCCMMIRREVMETIGLLDDAFFLYYEDQDYCIRILQSGWKIYYLGTVTIIHHWGKAISQEGDKLYAQLIKSQYHYCRKHYGWWSLLLVAPLVFLRELAALTKWCSICVLKKDKRNYAKQKLSLHTELLKLSLTGITTVGIGKNLIFIGWQLLRICLCTILATSFLPIVLPRKLSRRFKSAQFLPQNILVIRSAALGDLLLSTPVFRALKHRFPEAKLTLLVAERYKEVIKNISYLDEHITCNFLPKISSISAINELKKCVSYIRKQKYDLLVNLDTNFLSGLLTLVSKSTIRIGQSVGIHRYFYDRSVKPVRSRHYIDNTLSIVQLIGANDTARRLEFVPDQQAHRFAVNFIANYGINTNDLVIGVHPGAGNQYCKDVVKRWTTAGFAYVLDELINRYCTKVIIMGADEDIPVAYHIYHLMKHQSIIAAGKTDVQQLAALIARCSLLICHDSAPLHIAVAMGTPTVSIWGSFAPTEYGPRTDMNKHLTVTSTVPCYPCWQYRCRLPEPEQWQCLDSIAPYQVLQTVINLITQLQLVKKHEPMANII